MSASWEFTSTSQRSYHGLHTLKRKAQILYCTSKGDQRRQNFHAKFFLASTQEQQRESWPETSRSLCAVQNRKASQRSIKTALQHIHWVSVISPRCLLRAQRVLKHNTHPACSACCLLAEVCGAVPPDGRAALTPEFIPTFKKFCVNVIIYSLGFHIFYIHPVTNHVLLFNVVLIWPLNFFNPE